MKKIVISILLGLMMLPGFVNAQDDKADTKKDEKQAKEDGKRVYSEAEFHQAVLAEVEKQLKKIGRSKLVDLSRELLEKEEQLRLRDLEHTKKQEQIDINAQQFDKKVKAFQARQSKLLACLDDVDEKKNNRISHMVDAVSGMKPVKAAEVLSVQDPEISVKILGKLDAIKVSKIFNLMDKEISARLQKQYMTMKR